MTFDEIQELIKLLNKSNLTEFIMEQGDFKITIRTKKYGKIKTQQIVPAQQQIVPLQTAPVPNPQYMPSAAPSKSESTNQDEEAPVGTTESYIEIRSPIVGTFYRSASPEKPPYVKVGDLIEEGTVVCIVEAMKLFNEIESEVSGKVVKVMVEDAQPVEYDQVLFLVDPNG